MSKDDGWTVLRSAFVVAGAGTTWVAAVVAGYFAGRALDRWWGSAPWAMVGGVLLGAVAGFIELMRLTKRFLK